MSHTPAALLAPHPVLNRYYADEGARRGFVRRIFDDTACDYDHVEQMMALGTGSWYRRQALRRAGLRTGMRVLDVAMGTGLVARQAVAIVGDRRRVLGIDPSRGMLQQARQSLNVPMVSGTAERLPVADGAFDFLSMGFALRHLSELGEAFSEFYRVLRPGGTVCLLEMTRPRGWLMRQGLRWYMKGLVPFLARLGPRRNTAGTSNSHLLWEYYWDTIDSCVMPERVLEALRNAGFDRVRRHVELGLFSEYVACKLKQPEPRS